MFTSPFALPKEWHFSHYPEAWEIGKFSKYYKNTFIITILSVVILIPSVVMAAYTFTKMEFFGKKFLLYLILFGLIIPFQSFMISLYYTLRDIHLINTYFAMVFPLVAVNIPFGVFYMRAFFLNFPTELLDAARVDGCSEARVILEIVVPMSKSAITTLGIFQAVLSWNAFMIPLLYTQSDELRPVTLGLMYFQGRYSTNYSLTTAAAIMVSLPLIIIFLIFRRGFIQGLAAGALK
jgi:raffinose/stachyose/melibiose transport system permease protein